MDTLKSILAVALILLLAGCEEDWKEHYGNEPITVDQNVWNAIQEDENLSMFVQYVKDNNFDTLFLKENDPYTLFVPDNEAFSSYSRDTIGPSLLNYLISNHYIQSANIRGKRKIQTLSEKYALFERRGSDAHYDEIFLDYESPLYMNGKYYTMGSVAEPKPNLYQYYAVTNPVFKRYIDEQDSIILDKELSRPIGFDEEGNTIYDTVAIIYNEFEELFFPIREEFRNKSATIVFPKEEDYNNALTEMAQSLGETYQDYNDIPYDWQEDILIPYLLENGVFLNMLEPEEFLKTLPTDTVKLKNVLGDSIIIDYEPVDKTLCSNGYAYNYSDFSIPDTLFTGSVRLEGEWLVEETGINKFSWLPEIVSIDSEFPTRPLREYIKTASNDSILKVDFPGGYDGKFNATIRIENLFPRKYLMVVRTHMYVGGLYEVYMNDELVATIDYFDYVMNNGVFWSVTGPPYRPEGGFNRWDCWVDNTANYGEAKLRFEYKGPSNVSSNGLVIDYIEFIPVDE